MDDDLLNDPRLTASGLLIEAFFALTTRLSQVHADHGLAGTDFDILLRLARSPGRRLRMTDLAAQTALSTSGITRVVDRLESGGLVQRIACPGDRRSYLTKLTDAGYERLCADVPPLLDVIQRWLVDPIAPNQFPVFLDALRAVRDTVRPTATEGASP